MTDVCLEFILTGCHLRTSTQVSGDISWAASLYGLVICTPVTQAVFIIEGNLH